MENFKMMDGFRTGAHKDGCGGLWEHAYHQGYDSASIQAAVRALHKKSQSSALFSMVAESARAHALTIST